MYCWSENKNDCLIFKHVCVSTKVYIFSVFFHYYVYTQQGDYLLPDLKLPNQPKVEIGVFGKRRLRYLEHNRKILYTNLLTKGKLTAYLADIDEQAENMFDRLVSQLAEREGVTEHLKAENQMLWVKKMNSICNRAEEIVNHELIYN